MDGFPAFLASVPWSACLRKSRKVWPLVAAQMAVRAMLGTMARTSSAVRSDRRGRLRGAFGVRERRFARARRADS
ncbi:hypothetical protein GCM10010505_49490 [Kitasatospora aburaviensis]